MLRSARVLAILTVVCAAGLSFQPANAAGRPRTSPAPTVASVTTRLDALSRRAERLAEQFNKSRIEVAAAQRAAARSQRAAADTAAHYRDGRAAFVAIITAQYESGSISPAANALLTSRSGQDYVTQLQLIDIAANNQTTVLNRLRDAEAAAHTAQTTAALALRTADARRATVTVQRARAAAETTKFTALLATLTERQRQVCAARAAATAAQAAAARTAAARTSATHANPAGPRNITASLPTVHAAGPAAQRAVNFALAQLGKPYVFGAAGPGAYDCSGLTMAAWGAAGVSLPHLAASQYSYGTHVAASQLQPGDLVFMYSPIGHVSLYIGRGMLVSAPQPGENVKLVPLAYMMADFVGATRLS